METGTVVFLVVWTSLVVLTIAAVVDAARIPSERWKAAGLDKTTWIVLLIVGNIVAAPAYFGWIRKRLR